MATSQDLDSIASEIIVDVLEEIAETDSKLDKALTRTKMRVEHPKLAEMHAKYCQDEEENEQLDYELYSDKVDKLLLSRFRELAMAFCTKDDEEIEKMSKDQLIEFVEEEVNKLGDEVKQSRELDERIKELTEKLNQKTLEVVSLSEEMCEEQGNLRLSHDKVDVELLMAKAKTRMEQQSLKELEDLMDKYGNETVIKRNKQVRKELDRESQELDQQIATLRSKLTEYELCDPTIVDNFKKMYEELKCRRWAMNMSMSQYADSSSLMSIDSSMASPQQRTNSSSDRS